MRLFPFEIDDDKLREALHIAVSFRGHGRHFFSPTTAVRNYLSYADEAILVRAITVRGPEGHSPLQEGLQAYGKPWPPSSPTSCAYINAIALAIWELSRRATERARGETVVPTFGEIGAVAIGAGFQPSRQTTTWNMEKLVREFASYCRSTCNRDLAVFRGKLSSGEQLGIARLLLSTNAEAETEIANLAKGAPSPAGGKSFPSPGAGFGEAEQNRKIEQAAIRLVTDWYVRKGWKVRSMEALRCGFDLLCTHASVEDHVEVKGVSGADRNFTLTAGELRKAKNDGRFLLALVTNALSGRPSLELFAAQRFLSEFRFEPIQYRATAI
jgi:hypothetical protein